MCECVSHTALMSTSQAVSKRDCSCVKCSHTIAFPPLPRTCQLYSCAMRACVCLVAIVLLQQKAVGMQESLGTGLAIQKEVIRRLHIGRFGSTASECFGH